jgi:hypothetical protein
MLNEALHKDDGKAPWHLLMWKAVAGVVEVLKYGSTKYAPRNWEQGIRFSRLFASALRHMLQWWDGEDIDSESGLHHLKHAATNLLMIVEFIERNKTEFDDRPKHSQGSRTLASQGGGGDTLYQMVVGSCIHPREYNTYGFAGALICGLCGNAILRQS